MPGPSGFEYRHARCARRTDDATQSRAARLHRREASRQGTHCRAARHVTARQALLLAAAVRLSRFGRPRADVEVGLLAEPAAVENAIAVAVGTGVGGAATAVGPADGRHDGGDGPALA